eukprot:TRINITY_DN4175_c0_g2_i1.p1 TRINITY_DN4175_c0_g2~~TRINITY_DN4175_c0_g2_i1.p1  ORF type:complete len:286 (+),score=99.26 TRINITY_DN4175_c0_g2_i1:82-939(+)
MTGQILYRDEADTRAKLSKLRQAAREGRLCVVADFDRTLTRCFMPDGSRAASAYGVMERHAHFAPSYRERVRELFDKYYPIETHPTMSVDEKIPHMVEWYTAAHRLLLEEEVTESTVVRAAKECEEIALRDGAAEFLWLCQESSPPVPTIVLSAGMGNVIRALLETLLPFPASPTTNVVANWLRFEDGRLVGFSEPLMHMFNKSLGWAPKDLLDSTSQCDCCLLVGDGVGDATMSDGREWDTVLKVGMLNEVVEERKDKYLRHFDAVVCGDAALPAHLFADVVRA